MEISNTVALLILALALLGLYILGGCKMGCLKSKDSFTRTCLSADDNCKFVRSPVDYAFEDITEIPAHIGMEFPHMMGKPSDPRQPLDANRIDLIKDEKLLNAGSDIWKQYGNDFMGCGNGKEYIVNDDKTRWMLTDVGDIAAVRMLESMAVPKSRWGPISKRHPALTDQDMIMPDPFDALYGGSEFLHRSQALGI